MGMHKTTVIDGKTLAESYDLLGTNQKNISQTGHGFAAGNWVKRSSGLYALAQANSAGNARVIGIVEKAIPGSLGEYIQILVHANGANGSTVFPDSSSYARTVTASGGAKVTTAVKKFGSGSCELMPQNSALSFSIPALGTSDWIWDVWVRFNEEAGPFAVNYIQQQTGTGGNFTIYLGYGGAYSGKLYLDFGGSGVYFSKGSEWPTLTWFHLAIIRKGNDVRGYVNGTQIDTSKDVTSQDHTNTTAILFGRDSAGAYGWTGEFDELQISSCALATDPRVVSWWDGFSAPTGEYGASDEFLLVMGGATQSSEYAFADADQHWLSPTVAGGIVTTEPSTSGQIIKPLMIATGATSGIVQVGNGLVIP